MKGLSLFMPFVFQQQHSLQVRTLPAEEAGDLFTDYYEDPLLEDSTDQDDGVGDGVDDGVDHGDDFGGYDPLNLVEMSEDAEHTLEDGDQPLDEEGEVDPDHKLEDSEHQDLDHQLEEHPMEQLEDEDHHLEDQEQRLEGEETEDRLQDGHQQVGRFDKVILV